MWTISLNSIKTQEKLLIVHMDDIGMCNAANKAAADLFQKGTVNSASVMMPCPWAFDFIQWSKANPRYDVGLHLTLTSEWEKYRWRSFSSGFSTGLRDGEGFMWRNTEDLAKNASGVAVEHELTLQADQAKKWGLRLSHFDSHMYFINAKPELFRVFRLVAAKYRVVPYIPPFMADSRLSLFHKAEYLITKSNIEQQLKTLGPGLNVLVIHPSADTPELRAIMPEWKDRVLEYELFMHEDTGKMISKLGFRQVTWAEAHSMMG